MLIAAGCGGTDASDTTPVDAAAPTTVAPEPDSGTAEPDPEPTESTTTTSTTAAPTTTTTPTTTTEAPRPTRGNIADLLDLGNSILGPTEDLSETIAAVVEVPDLPTLADTELVQVDVSASEGRGAALLIRFVTSAEASEVFDVYTEAVIGLFPDVEVISESPTERTFNVPDESESIKRIGVLTLTGQTEVTLSVPDFVDSDEIFDRISVWTADIPAGDGQLGELRLGVAEQLSLAGARFDYSSSFDEMLASTEQRLADAGWEVLQPAAPLIAGNDELFSVYRTPWADEVNVSFLPSAGSTQFVDFFVSARG